ncbi:MAG: FAD-binding protein [Azospirillum sp.]|nr:FAD-binding protein [Azospirillum sp.]
MAILKDSGVLILGSGLAGLTVALRCAELGVPGPITVLTKTPSLAGGSSFHAQGGIAAALGADDQPEAHAADTVAAGAGLTDPAMAALLAGEGAGLMRALLADRPSFGPLPFDPLPFDPLPFDRGPDGRPLLGQEAAHGVPRVLHAGGDATGRTLMTVLGAQVLQTPAITVNWGAVAVELVVRHGRVCGVLASHPDGWVLHRSAQVVLATGGIGAAFLRTTNPPESTGDGLALAARARARLADIEFVQFHPTALATATTDGAPAPLLTEALRGAGAVLLDDQGRRFMADEHPAAELAPRDVVARAIGRRIAGGQPVFLDLRPALVARPGAFPTAVTACRAAGFDPYAAPVPVAPAAHYHMGGVATGTDGRTSLDGLWACGEVACTGVHGANRLASNSLLEALVFGSRAAADLAACPTPALPPLPLLEPPRCPGPEHRESVTAIAIAARQAIYQGIGLVRSGAALRTTGRTLERLEIELAGLPGSPAPPPCAVRLWVETGNLLLVGRLLAHAALSREESRGAHCRSDFPAMAAAARHHSFTLDFLSGLAGAAAGDSACQIR